MAFPILLTAFIAVPILEIWLLLKVGSVIGGFKTILFVIFTAILGAYLVRQQGFATLSSVQNQMNAGRVPTMEIAEGLALLIAGAVLLTPGFATDALGFALLTPPIRRSIIRWLSNRKHLFTSSYSDHSSYHSTHQTRNHQHSPNDNGSVIEGEFSERE